MKDTNPKDAIGVRKWRQFFVVPRQVLWEVGVGMLEGALKYGRHNYRASGVRASVYCDAAMGHIEQFIEGEDVDKDSGLSHVTKAICSLVVLRDAMLNDFWQDDRPPKIKDMDALRDRLQKTVEGNFERYKDKNPHHYAHLGDGAPYRQEVIEVEPNAHEWEAEAARVFYDGPTPSEHVITLPGVTSQAVAEALSKMNVSGVRVGEIEQWNATPADFQDQEILATARMGVVAHEVDGVRILHPDDPHFDVEHVFESLTSKQFCRLVVNEAGPGALSGLNCMSKSGNLTIYNPAAFDTAARALISRISAQPLCTVELRWAVAWADRRSRVSPADWRRAIPDLVDAQLKPNHGMMKPRGDVKWQD